jgi:Flp pilus assembly protein TadB
MTAALLAAIATWCAVTPSARGRARRVLGEPGVVRRPDAAVVAAVIVPVATIVVVGAPWGVVVGVALAPVAHRMVGRLESTASRRRAARIEASLPGALDLLVAALAAGRPPVTAFALAAEAVGDPLGAELEAVAGRLAIAADPGTVWDSVVADPALAPVGRAFRRASSSGMPVAEIVAGVADELRRERSARLRELGQRVGVRTAAPLGLCFLPAFFLIGIVPTLAATFTSFRW